MTIEATDSAHKKSKKLYYFFLALLLALGVTWLVHEPLFTQAQTYVLFLLVFSIGLWLTEAVPPFSVGLFIIAFLVYTLGYEKISDSPADITIYTSTFSSGVIWLMLAGFFLASAMTKTKLDVDLIHLALKVCGTNPKWILFVMMLVTMTASMLISNTATTSMVVAALMPMLAKLGKGSKLSKALILGVPIAATTGGMGTMIGSPANAIAVAALTNVGQSLDFVTWIYYGLPVALTLTFLSWLLLVRIFMVHVTAFSMEEIEIKKEEHEGTSINRWIVILVLLLTLILWLTTSLHGLSAAAVSAFPLVLLPLTRVLDGNDIRAMGWDTLILVAGGLALGIGLQETGLVNLYASRIASLQVSPTVFYFLLAYTTMFFSNIMSNTATSTVLIPLGMAILPNNLKEVAIIIGLSASTALFLPVSTPPNAIAYSTGYIEQKDFRIGGAFIGLIGPALIVIWVLLIS